jgi:hypothetical protein
MNALIQKWLDKIGVKNVSDLSSDEKATYDNWSKILSEGEITVEKIKEFCKSQKKLIETQYTNPDNTDKKDNILKASLGIYNALIGLIEGPRSEKESLEKYLEQLIK